MTELYHHGILGQRWGIRRYQNKDGTLTPEGRERYLNDNGTLNKEGRKLYQYKNGKLKKAGKERIKDNWSYRSEYAWNSGKNKDILLKKGTKVSQVMTIDEYPEEQERIWKRRTESNVKNVAVDGTRFSDKQDGKLQYFLANRGYGGYGLNEFNDMKEALANMTRINEYTLVNDLRVASGKKVADETIKYLEKEDPRRLAEYIDEKYVRDPHYPTLTQELRDTYLLNDDAINKELIKQGYKAVTNIADDSFIDMPVTILDSSVLSKPKVQTGKEYVEEIEAKYITNKPASYIEEKKK